MGKSNIKPWHEVVRLRADIRSQELSLKAFAADLHDVLIGANPGVYHDPKEFFALTYPTTRLRDLARDVVHRLSGKSEKAVRQLHMTFGGGKTHSLITLVHLCSNPETLPDVPAVQQFKAHIGTGLPKARIAAVVFDRLDAERGMEAKAPNGKVARFKMPWSLLAWQLGGEAALKLLKDDGTERASPPATNVLEDILKLARSEVPAILILFDEVLWFVRMMADQDPGWVARMADFFHSLTQAVAKTPQCCLVASLLASDTKKMDELGKKISKDLYDEFKRVADEGIQPVEPQDVPEILRRRLFDLDSYVNRDAWPGQVIAALNGIQALDETTAKQRTQEEKRYLEAFPFHPDFVGVLYTKWTQLEGFQQTRGILKTLASALRDSLQWDKSPLIGPQVLLSPDGEEALSTAMREMTGIAQLEQYEGRHQNWTAILQAEFRIARVIQSELPGLAQNREVEQAVVAAFLHSQPIGARMMTRDLLLLLGTSTPDRIELGKGLARWSEASWYLDDTFTGEKEVGLPKLWRLGSKPNLRQMHFDARAHIPPSVLEEVLDKEIRGTSRLTEGARAAGARVHLLPARPAEVEDDGEFKYVVLGPKAASESGKPSSEARRFIDETTTSERPRATNRNAVVLVTPSRDGIELAREKVRDFLGWEKVREMLKDRNDLDTAATARLETNARAARGEMTSQIVMAYCIAVTVNASNDVAAVRVNVDNEPLFPKLASDKRLRIESTAVNAEALLPGGPYDLWAEGEKSRYVKDLVGAFASTARLPKMLNRSAILETLLLGCEAGDFVLRVTRNDKSQRTFWRVRPDDIALQDSSLEVVLSDAAVLNELAPALLAPLALPGLWQKEALTFADISAYFSGKHFVAVDKGAYSESLLIPAADEDAIRVSVSAAVRQGCVWLVNGTISALGEDVPTEFVNEHAALYALPQGIMVADLLPTNLGAAWKDEETTAYVIHASLSAKAGKPLPWSVVRQALDGAFRLGILERTLESGTWPCDMGGAGTINIRLRKGGGDELPPPRSFGAKVGSAKLETHELQELADHVDELRQATAGHRMQMTVTLEVGEEGKVPDKVIDAVNRVLGSVKQAWIIR